MHKFKHGQLHSGSKKGPEVKNRKQAIAIMLSEKRNESEHGGKYTHSNDSKKKSKVETGPSQKVRKNHGI